MTISTPRGADKFYFLPLDSYGWVVTVVEGHKYK